MMGRTGNCRSVRLIGSIELSEIVGRRLVVAERYISRQSDHREVCSDAGEMKRVVQPNFVHSFVDDPKRMRAAVAR